MLCSNTPFQVKKIICILKQKKAYQLFEFVGHKPSVHGPGQDQYEIKCVLDLKNKHILIYNLDVVSKN